MRNKEIEYNNKTLTRINAKKLDNILKNYKNNIGLTIYTLPNNANWKSPFIGGFFEIEINAYKDYYEYINELNEISFYNCNNELGNYLVFYIEK